MTRVFVGMSGGVDSSLTAALLQEQDYRVTGVYMKNWTQDLPGMQCPWADDLADAKRVAVQLGIDLKVYDFETEYRDKVVQYMIDAYQQGYTPNPDIMCNQEVKFKLFFNAALADGADYIATGHYATTKHGQLHQAVDKNKDQTYFLYRVTERALRHTLLPLGGYTKPQVRAMATERGLYTAAKKDSQGICFVGKVGIREFLSQYVTTQPGPIIEQASGRQLGMHDGAIFYTLGQRHGLQLGGGLPYYVVGKDMARNEVYVSTDLNNQAMWRDKLELGALHWINGQPGDGTYQVRIRHRAPLVPAELVGTTLHIREPQRAAAPGQSVVLYHGQQCLGGGIIV
ncbi:tRNA 2-thiouridine(34) synthase MnmA [Candidatus Saccharibacteria bacterium]|nr:tRNA 2-thiouridine(34) synthase MnmA [Candidatus Saccharibacteria bacterium]